MLDPGTNDSAFDIPNNSMVFLDVIPTGFQGKAFGALICPVKDLSPGVSDIEHRSFTSQGKVPYF